MMITVDLGSTNFKAALFDAQGKRLGEGSRPLPYSIHSNHRTELLPEQVTACFLDVLRATAEAGGLTLDQVRKVAITSQAQTFLIARSDGTPISPFYGWTDDRATEEAAFLQATLGEQFHRRAGFASVSPRLTVSKVLWWKKEHGWDPDYRVVTLPSYLGMVLGAAHGSDANLAAMTGFYSIPDGTWCPHALAATGVDAIQLGGLVPPGVALAPGERAGPSGFHPELEVIPVGNDHTAGAMGCRCGENRSILTLGTAGVLYRYAGPLAGPYSAGGLWGPYPGGGHYELKCLSHACSAVDWADAELFGKVDSPRFVKHAAQAKVTLKSPYFNPVAWGSDEAWSGQGTVEEKAYAALEGVIFALRSMAGKGFVSPGGEVVMLGGGSRLDFWVQLAADSFQCSIQRSSTDGLDGTARIAGLKPQVASDMTKAQPFVPGPERQTFLDERYRAWLERAGATPSV